MRPNLTGDYGFARLGVVFDPLTLTVGSMAATAVGGALSASSTLAGGDYAAQAGVMQRQASTVVAGLERTQAEAEENAANYQAEQVTQNASQALAAGQRQMFETQEKTRLLTSSAKARAGASGVNAGVGSAVTNTGEIAQRGSYHALLDMFNGESTASGLLNQAEGIRYSGKLARFGGEISAASREFAGMMAEREGQAKKSASQSAALGTLAGSAGSMMSTYGKFAYPTTRGNFGA